MYISCIFHVCFVYRLPTEILREYKEGNDNFDANNIQFKPEHQGDGSLSIKKSSGSNDNSNSNEIEIDVSATMEVDTAEDNSRVDARDNSRDNSRVDVRDNSRDNSRVDVRDNSRDNSRVDARDNDSSHSDSDILDSDNKNASDDSETSKYETRLPKPLNEDDLSIFQGVLDGQSVFDLNYTHIFVKGLGFVDMETMRVSYMSPNDARAKMIVSPRMVRRYINDPESFAPTKISPDDEQTLPPKDSTYLNDKLCVYISDCLKNVS